MESPSGCSPTLSTRGGGTRSSPRKYGPHPLLKDAARQKQLLTEASQLQEKAVALKKKQAAGA